MVQCFVYFTLHICKAKEYFKNEIMMQSCQSCFHLGDNMIRTDDFQFPLTFCAVQIVTVCVILSYQGE
jgi:hypothetical protein